MHDQRREETHCTVVKLQRFADEANLEQKIILDRCALCPFYAFSQTKEMANNRISQMNQYVHFMTKKGSPRTCAIITAEPPTEAGMPSSPSVNKYNSKPLQPYVIFFSPEA